MPELVSMVFHRWNSFEEQLHRISVWDRRTLIGECLTDSCPPLLGHDVVDLGRLNAVLAKPELMDKDVRRHV